STLEIYTLSLYDALPIWKKDYALGRLPHETYTSAIVFPIKVNKDLMGHIFLLKEVRDGFNKEMIDIISTFVGQATISVENYRLRSEEHTSELQSRENLVS